MLYYSNANTHKQENCKSFFLKCAIRLIKHWRFFFFFAHWLKQLQNQVWAKQGRSGSSCHGGKCQSAWWAPVVIYPKIWVFSCFSQSGIKCQTQLRNLQDEMPNRQLWRSLKRKLGLAPCLACVDKGKKNRQTKTNFFLFIPSKSVSAGRFYLDPVFFQRFVCCLTQLHFFFFQTSAWMSRQAEILLLFLGCTTTLIPSCF